MLAKAKLALSITFIVLASFTIVTFDCQNMFIIQATEVIHYKITQHSKCSSAIGGIYNNYNFIIVKFSN